MRPGGGNRVPKPEYAHQLLPEHLVDGNLSIAVFGPGEGEAIVVQLPDGSVGVVDGCREPKPPHQEGRGDPVRELLDAIASNTVMPADFRLAFVCLTHPHDDHYGGLGRLMDAYQGRIDCTWTTGHVTGRHANALREWLRLKQGRRKPMPDDVMLAGLTRVIEQFHVARERHESEPKRVLASIPLLSRDTSSGSLTITACGPAVRDIERAEEELIDLLSAKERGESVTASYDPNLTSGALLIRWSRAAILLAGDLLNGATQNSGWQNARRHVDCEVHVVNAAHHASEGAHDKELWDKMRPSLAIVTPFKHGRGSNPPRPTQISALARGSVVAITSPPAWVGRTDCPVPMSPKQPRGFDAKNSALPLTPTNQADAIRNAVSISIDAAGNITRFVVAGDADVYLAPEEVAVPTPRP